MFRATILVLSLCLPAFAGAEETYSSHALGCVLKKGALPPRVFEITVTVHENQQPFEPVQARLLFPSQYSNVQPAAEWLAPAESNARETKLVGHGEMLVVFKRSLEHLSATLHLGALAQDYVCAEGSLNN